MKKVNNESVILSEVYRKLVVEFDIESMSIDDILSAIIVITKDYDPTPRPKGVLNALCDYKEFPVTRNGDKIEFIVEIDDEIKEEGGEIVEKPNFKTRFTSGEEKVAESVIKKFGEGFKIRTPSRIVFEDCLATAFPKIGSNSHQAVEKLIKGGYLQEKEGVISLGEEGKKILSQ